MIIRDAVFDDLKRIVEIYNSTIPGRMVTADTEFVSVEDKVEWFNSHNSKFRPFWVVEENGIILGWLSFSSFYGRPAYNGTVELSIYIAEEARGCGIGKLLMKNAIEYAPKIGVENLLGFIFAHNEPSLKLFQRFNYERWAYMPGIAKLDDIKRDLVIMGLKVE